ncbi:MAG: hypothetical protein HYR55_03295 [Acidobacteria bacterium]|nr:hypothetical protein [Acidobacteriota bacterium]
MNYLDAAQAKGLRVLLGIPREWVQDFPNKETQIRARVNTFKGHLALYAWQVYDEPESAHDGFPPVPFANLNNTCNAIHQEDPNHPTFITPNAAVDASYPYLAVNTQYTLQYDTVIPEGGWDTDNPNPPYQRIRSIWSYLEDLANAHADSFTILNGRNIPFGWVLQGHNLANDPSLWSKLYPAVRNNYDYRPRPGYPRGGIYPSVEQMRYMAYGGFIHGAKSAIFLEYRVRDNFDQILEDISPFSPFRPYVQQWEAVTNVATELSTMGPILLTPTQDLTTSGVSFGTGSWNPNGNTAVKQYQGKTYLVTVNPSPNSATRQIRLSPIQFPNPRITLLPAGTSILFQSGYFNAEWGPNEARIYQIDETVNGYTLTAGPSPVAPGGTVTVSWTAPAGHATTDWVGLYLTSTVGDQTPIQWRYVPAGTSGNMAFVMPPTPGTYHFRYFLNDGYTRVRNSNAVTVQ